MVFSSPALFPYVVLVEDRTFLTIYNLDDSNLNSAQPLANQILWFAHTTGFRGHFSARQ